MISSWDCTKLSIKFGKNTINTQTLVPNSITSRPMEIEISQNYS